MEFFFDTIVSLTNVWFTHYIERLLLHPVIKGKVLSMLFLKCDSVLCCDSRFVTMSAGGIKFLYSPCTSIRLSMKPEECDNSLVCIGLAMYIFLDHFSKQMKQVSLEMGTADKIPVKLILLKAFSASKPEQCTKGLNYGWELKNKSPFFS